MEEIKPEKTRPLESNSISESQRAVINRISRALGHLEKVKEMVAQGADCADVLIQLAAVRSALNNTGKVILKDHLRQCLEDAVSEEDQDVTDGICKVIDRFV